MPEIMRFSLYKSKLTKYIFGIVFASFIIPICSAQPTSDGKKNVDDFRFATWNKAGKSNNWNQVHDFMVNGGLDVLLLQEAGDHPELSIRNPTTVPGQGTLSPYDLQNYNQPETCAIGSDLNENYGTLVEYELNFGNDRFYMYYYDRRLSGAELPTVRRQTYSPSTNHAIITRQRADRLFILPPMDRFGAELSRGDERFDVNRPVIGVQLENSVFFDVHAEPTQIQNEAREIIRVLQSYMADEYPQLTWVAGGDFNRPPDTLLTNVDLENNTFREVVRSGEMTHPARGRSAARELDYFVWGGHVSYPHRAIQALLLIDYINRNVRLLSSASSDHLPVVGGKL